MSSNIWPFFLLIFSRLSGLFVFSPLFSEKGVSFLVRLSLSLACSLSLTPFLMGTFSYSFEKPLYFALDLLKEGMLGFVIGWIFALLFESAAFAGQFLGVLMGLSATEILDPNSNASSPLLGRFFALFTLTLFLILDLHHPLLRLLYESYHSFPLKYPLTQTTAFGCIEISNLLFQNALGFAFIPLTMLFSLILIFALLSRFMPIFWIGFPLQLIVGLSSLGLSVKYFAPMLEHSFYQSINLVKKFIVNF